MHSVSLLYSFMLFSASLQHLCQLTKHIECYIRTSVFISHALLFFYLVKRVSNFYFSKTSSWTENLPCCKYTETSEQPQLNSYGFMKGFNIHVMWKRQIRTVLTVLIWKGFLIFFEQVVVYAGVPHIDQILQKAYCSLL